MQQNNHRDSYYKKGVEYVHELKLDEAINCFNKVLEIDPQYVNAYNFLGFVHRMQNKHRQAIQDFTKALELEPNNPYACHQREYALEILGE